MTNAASGTPVASPDTDGRSTSVTSDAGRHQVYNSDLVSRTATIIGVTAAGVGGAIFTLLCWFILKRTNLPAFGGSLVSRALGNAGSIFVLLITVGFVYWWLRDEHNSNLTANQVRRPRWRTWLTYMVCYLSPAALVVTTTAIPLSATKLYLDGVTVDQGFRNQFFTRLTDSTQLSDMNYLDMPSYYPAGWFWVGGRFANLLGLTGWEAFQPWALVSISITACMLVPIWQRLCGSLAVATAISLVSICIVLVTSAEEPYAAIIALGAPAATVLAGRAVEGSWPATFASIVYLGTSASMYTLYTAVIALSVVCVSGFLGAGLYRSFKPFLRLLFIGLASAALACIVWGPYLMAVFQGRPRSGATAMHYLPAEGARLPLPMLSFSVIGVLCMFGLVFLVVRAVDHDIRAMGVGLVVLYGWIVASMVATLTGNTLLGFRLDSLVTLQLATPGVLAIAEIRLLGAARFYPAPMSPRKSRTITVVMLVLLTFTGVSYAQRIPNHNSNAIDLAYTDTDGNGERADRYPPDSGAYYPEINRRIQDAGYVPRNTVVLTDESNFMSFYPYRGFQAFTSHYANPLGEFGLRNQVIDQWANQSWSSSSDPAQFTAALGSVPWHSPDVFIFTGNAEGTNEGWKYDIAEDIYPNNPNVRYRGVYFNPSVFLNNSKQWNVSQVGPFVVVTRIHDGS